MTDWSSEILLWLAGHRTPFGLIFFSRITEFGGAAASIIALVAASLALSWGRRWAHALGLIVSLGGAIAVSMFLKLIFQFDRPDLVLRAVVEDGYTFPSNHATAAMALYGFLMWCVWDLYPRWTYVAAISFVAVIGLIGFSRLYLGVHWPADVFAGFLLGLLFVQLGIFVTRRLQRFEA